MCRLAAYLGPSIAPETILIAPSHSLIQQSAQAQEAKLSVNGDGFGLAWYGARAEPGLFRHTLPAWSDENLLSLARHISTPLFLAHVRASTAAETTQSNCHPFVHGRWSFMHNGQIGQFDRIRRRLEARLSDPLYLSRRGTTDSELIFLLMLELGLEEDAEAAIRRTIDAIHDDARAAGLKPFLRMTCVLSDGVRVLAMRHASDAHAPTLYMSDDLMPGATVLASEPLTIGQDGWHLLPANTILSFGPSEARAAPELRRAV